MKYFGSVRSIEDFVCVEFQAAGATGTPWEAVLEYKERGSFSKDGSAAKIHFTTKDLKVLEDWKIGMTVQVEFDPERDEIILRKI